MELCKVNMGLSLSIMNDILTLDQSTSHNLGTGVTMTKINIRTSKFNFGTASTIVSIF